MAENRIEIEIILDDGEIKKGFAKVERDSEKSGKRAGDDFNKGFSRGLKALAAAAVAAGAAVAAAFGVRRVVEAASAQEDAINLLNTSLRNAGTFSAEASKSFQEFASQIQATSRFGDEVVLQQAALARNFARSNDEAIELTRAAVDLSEATGITLDSAVRNLGKTFAGLTGELGESVPALRNLTAEQLKNGEAIALVAQLYGGTASQTVQTFSGRISQLSNTFGDLLESLGGLITGSPVLVAVLGEISKAISGAASEIRGLGSGPVDNLVVSIIQFAQVVNDFLVLPIEVAVKTINLAFQGLKIGIQGLISTFAIAASSIVSFFSPDSELAQNLGLFSESSTEVFNGFVEDAQAAQDSIFTTDFSDRIAGFLEKLKETALTARGVIKDTASDLKNSVGGAVNEINKDVLALEKSLNSRLAAGLANAIQAGTQALIDGENAFEAFGKAVLSTFGDLAIQTGQFFIAQGIAISALSSIFPPSAIIAAGAALVAFGTLLKSFAGGASGVSGGAGTVGADIGGGTGPGGTFAPPELPPDEELVAGDRGDDFERSKAITVNVEGTVLDPRSTGLQIAELINDVVDSDGVVIRTG